MKPCKITDCGNWVKYPSQNNCKEFSQIENCPRYLLNKYYNLKDKYKALKKKIKKKDDIINNSDIDIYKSRIKKTDRD